MAARLLVGHRLQNRGPLVIHDGALGCAAPEASLRVAAAQQARAGNDSDGRLRGGRAWPARGSRTGLCRPARCVTAARRITAGSIANGRSYLPTPPPPPKTPPNPGPGTPLPTATPKIQPAASDFSRPAPPYEGPRLPTGRAVTRRTGRCCIVLLPVDPSRICVKSDPGPACRRVAPTARAEQHADL